MRGAGQGRRRIVLAVVRAAGAQDNAGHADKSKPMKCRSEFFRKLSALAYAPPAFVTSNEIVVAAVV